MINNGRKFAKKRMNKGTLRQLYPRRSLWVEGISAHTQQEFWAEQDAQRERLRVLYTKNARGNSRRARKYKKEYARRLRASGVILSKAYLVGCEGVDRLPHNNIEKGAIAWDIR